jgi:formylmethanofuran dehydrogenase subunit D
MPVMQYVALRQYNLNPNLVVDGIVVKDGWDLLEPKEIDDFNLLTPADGARILITDVMTDEVNITWESTTLGGDPVSYTFKTDTVGGGTFSDPFIDVPSNNGGVDNQLTFTFGQINALLSSYGVAEGDSISFIWTVFASAGGITKEANMPFELKLVRESTVSVNKITTNTLKVYPNPTTSLVNIDLPSNLSSNAKVSLTNVLGQEVVLNDITRNANSMQVNVNHLPNGVYTIKVIDGGSVSTGSLVIQK